MSIKAANGTTHTLTKGEHALHHMLDLARVLRSGAAPRPRQVAGDPSGERLPPERLTTTPRDGDSPLVESRTKIELEESQPKESAKDSKEPTDGERKVQHTSDPVSD